MTNTTAPVSTLTMLMRAAGLGLLLLLAYIIGASAGATEVQASGTVVQPVAPAAALTPVEVAAALATVPEDHECVLRDADGTVHGVVADTDPRCAAWWADEQLEVAPSVTASTSALSAVIAADREASEARTVRAEDGTRVSSSFYDRKTTTGATQAVCDHLGKRRVTDPTYGHRCV